MPIIGKDPHNDESAEIGENGQLGKGSIGNMEIKGVRKSQRVRVTNSRILCEVKCIREGIGEGSLDSDFSLSLLNSPIP